MSEISVRQAAAADANNLAGIFDDYRQLYGCPPGPEAAQSFLRERLGNSESVILFAEHAGSPVAFVQLYPAFSSVLLARTFVLNDLYVLPAHRRKGVGRALLTAVTAFAKAAGAANLTLSTEMSNGIAQALYRSAGWVRDEQFFVYHFPVQAQPPVIS